MKKKISATILACTMLCNVALVHAQDVNFERIGQLKIILGDTNGNWNLEKLITKAELMQFAINGLNLKSATAYGNYFSDMDGHWAKNTANLAVDLKLAEKSDKFLPESNVTNAEAVKTVVKILGYEPMAKSMGGELFSYITVASQIGLTKDLTFVADNMASREFVATLMTNALTIPVMQQTGYGKHEEYKVADGKDGSIKTTLESLFE